MAKTFKNLLRPVEPTAPKPLSERDFFDLTDEPTPAKKAVGEAETTHNTHNISNSGNTSNTDNKSNTDAPGSSGLESSPGFTAAVVGSEGVRQTFVLSRGHLEQLRDYVHARRAQGDYTYSQKQALQDALDLLFASAEPAAPRPAQARELEQQRRQRIQRGRQLKGSE